MSKTVFLVQAGEKSKLPRFPLGCLALASYIRKKGYNPKVFDLRLDDSINFSSKPLCVCISSMSGPSLKSAIQLSKEVKQKHPEIPIVFGGHHASALPEQTVKESYIDAVVVGEGEKALIKVLRDIEREKLKQIYYQEKIDMEELDLPAYDLIDVKKYLDYTEGWSYEIARGCPHRCRFCYVHYFHDRKWRAKSAEKAISEIKYIVKQYGIKNLRLIEDNFFVSKKLVLDVCRGIASLGLKWSSYARIDSLVKYSDEEMKILKDSGCWLLLLGAESGSQKMLDYMQKDITPEQTIEAAKKCIKLGIVPVLFMMMALPKERKDHINETLDFYDKLTKMYGVEVNCLELYWPYAGTPMYEDAIEAGFKAPQSISEWANSKIEEYRLPWYKKIGLEISTIATLSKFKHLVNHLKHFSRRDIEKKVGLPYQLIMFGLFPFRISYAIRWRFRFFKFDYEWRLLNSIMQKLAY